MKTLVCFVGWWYGALPLMAVGAVYAVRGARRGWRGLRGAVHGDASQLVPLMEGFRTCIIGLALVGISAAWIWQRPVLLLLSIAIAAGETMETSLILFALRHGAHLEYGRPRARDRIRLCRKFCSGGHEEAVAPICVELKRPGSRIVQPQ
jgi:hypothetical protein